MNLFIHLQVHMSQRLMKDANLSYFTIRDTLDRTFSELCHNHGKRDVGMSSDVGILHKNVLYHGIQSLPTQYCQMMVFV